MARDWIILGASSSIAKAFARKVAPYSHHLILVGRDNEDLLNTASDLRIRFHVRVDVFRTDISNKKERNELLQLIENIQSKSSLFIAHSASFQNDELDTDKINDLVETNINATSQVIHHFINHAKKPQSLIYLSSVAGDRGRGGNSLYGASKKAIDTYLEGLKTTVKHVQIMSIRLGFIDTPQTYGKPGIFLAKSPDDCADFLFASHKKKNHRKYYPWFWRYIMLIIKAIPDRVFNHLKI